MGARLSRQEVDESVGALDINLVGIKYSLQRIEKKLDQVLPAVLPSPLLARRTVSAGKTPLNPLEVHTQQSQ